MTEDTQADVLEAALTDEERSLLDKTAEAVATRGLATPALFFLESMKPLGWVGSQVMHFFRPIVAVVLRSPIAWDRVSRLLERRGAIELLCRRLEARA